MAAVLYCLCDKHNSINNIRMDISSTVQVLSKRNSIRNKAVSKQKKKKSPKWGVDRSKNSNRQLVKNEPLQIRSM